MKKKVKKKCEKSIIVGKIKKKVNLQLKIEIQK